MNRREFIKYSAVSGMIALHPTVVLSRAQIIIEPSGEDDTDAINTALRASARIGDPAILANGVFTITDAIVVKSGGQLIGRGQESLVIFRGSKAGVIVRAEEPCDEKSVSNLIVKDGRSPIPFIARIGI